MGKKVLIVDDEKAIVDILDFNLRKEDYETVCAYDGPEGLRMAREENPDLMLLDVMLPGMDGFTVCRTLRDEGNDVPIVMITCFTPRLTRAAVAFAADAASTTLTPVSSSASVSFGVIQSIIR